MTRIELARTASREAAKLRTQFGIGLAEAICPYDIARRLGIVVHFKCLPSLEGMYSPKPTCAIIIGSLRPAGRKRFTCAHEIGHHVFNHGCQIDELSEDDFSEKSDVEFIAQVFASSLLMPKMAIQSAFSKRGWKILDCNNIQIYNIAQEFGVGFSSFVTHLKINFEGFKLQYKSMSLKSIRNNIAGFEIFNEIIVIDRFWNHSFIDVEIDDYLKFTEDILIEGDGLESDGRSANCYIAKKVGIYSVTFKDINKKFQVRIMRSQFEGLAKYRHLEEVDDE